MQTPPTTVPIADLVIKDRVRYEDDEIDDLCESLKRYGMLQPILIDDNNVLLDGFRRYTAAKKLGLESVPVYCKSRLTDAEYFEIELESNIRRRQFTWRENVCAVEKVHKTRAREAILSGTTWTLDMTGAVLGGYGHSYVWNCLQLAPVIDGDEYKACESITDAVRVMLRQKEDAALAEQRRRMSLTVSVKPQLETTDKKCVACGGTGKNSKGAPCSPCNGTGFLLKIADVLQPDVLSFKDLPEQEVDVSHTLFQGKVEDLLPAWPATCIDHIITDPPYAIDVANLQQATTALMDVTRVEETHRVEDNLDLLKSVIPHFFRVLKPTGFLVMWCDIMNWQFLYDQCSNAGFKVQRWPMTWHKTSSCKCQMAHVLTTKNEEFAIVCRKENATLPKPVQTSVFPCPNDAEKLSNPFAKPYDLWRFLIESFTTTGQIILDPFAGEGTCPLAALKLLRRTLAIECEAHHYNYMLEAFKTHWINTFGKVKFV